jgi:cytochrome P450
VRVADEVIGVGHQLEQDDVFNSYHIPKGSYVHALEWSFSRDPEVYPEPDLFNPQRWLDPASPVYKEPLTQYPSIQGHHSFGFGRRTCLGQNLTDAMLFVGCGGIAWGFDLSKKVDPVTGEEIYVPDNDYNSLLLVRPEPFEFEMKPRTEKHAKAIEQQYREVQEKLL